MSAAGQSQSSSTDGFAAPDCSDPTAATSPQCSGTSPTSQQPLSGNVSTQYPGMSGAAGGQASRQAGSQMNNQTYFDDGGLTAGERLNRPLLAPASQEPLSEFQKFVSATTGVVLPVFGADLFSNAATTFSPVDQGPVTADYLLGPGDELRIRVWGQISFNAAVRIDRSGDIYLPQVGVVHVAGLPYASVQQHVRSEIARVFRNFDLTVDMGQLRSIQVFVVGQVRRPGSYTISSLSTLINALFASGGPNAQGSLRHVQLKRQGQVVARFDFYDLLLRGDKSNDVPLLPGDVIFVPAVGAQVALTGSVRHPAIYELSDQNTIGQLLSDAGGPSPLASPARISVERLEAGGGRSAMEVALDAAGQQTLLRDGDLLRLVSAVPSYDKTVTLRGNTANPGRFAWHPGMRVSALIPDRTSLITRNYWWERTRLGLPGPEFEPDVTGPVQTQPRYPLNLQSLPCRAPATNSEEQQDTASKTGNNDSPCTPYERYNPNQLPEQYRYPQEQFAQQQSQQQQQSSSQSSGTADRSFSSGTGSSLGGQRNEQSTQMMGLGNVRTDVRLSAPEIDWNYAVIERLDPQTLKTSLIPFNLGRLVMDHDPSQDLELQSGDVVSIFSQADIRVPTAEQTKFVHLEGEFVGAGVYSAKPGETLRQLVERAGGITPQAYLYGSDFTRESTRVLQQQRINEYVRALTLQIERGGIEASSGSGSAQDVAASAAALSSERDLVDRLGQLRATGRIVFNLAADASSADLLPDLPLEDGDRFVLPSRPSTVSVIGAVYDQNSFLFEPGRLVKDYLHQSGGPNRDADRGRAFVIRADGSVISRDSRRRGEFNSARIHPGDTIVVPEKTFRPNNLRGLISYTQIFSQLALGAAAVAVLQ